MKRVILHLGEYYSRVDQDLKVNATSVFWLELELVTKLWKTFKIAKYCDEELSLFSLVYEHFLLFFWL